MTDDGTKNSVRRTSKSSRCRAANWPVFACHYRRQIMTFRWQEDR
ncbi:hypothetical protein [Novosphingobium sp.]